MHAFDLGLVGYAEALVLQKRAQAHVQAGGDDMLLLLEHPPTISIGRNSGSENLPPHLETVWNGHVDVARSTRGGNITCHFPGQLVAYPVINLKKRAGGVRAHVYGLEEAAIRTLARFQVRAARRQSFPGVWTGGKKIASLGIAVNRCVTMHGLALNVAHDLSLFNIIAPCGLKNVAATSMARETAGPAPAMDAVKTEFFMEFHAVFLPDAARGGLLPPLRTAGELAALLQHNAERTTP